RHRAGAARLLRGGAARGRPAAGAGGRRAPSPRLPPPPSGSGGDEAASSPLPLGGGGAGGGGRMIHASAITTPAATPDRTLERAVVIAVGGNALIQDGERGTIAEQFANARATARRIAALVAAGW